MKGKKCEGFFSYINEIQTLIKIKSSAKSTDEFASLDHLDEAMAVNAAN